MFRGGFRFAPRLAAMAPRFVAREDRAPIAARVPALRLGKRGAKRSSGRRSTPAGTSRKLLVTILGRGQEQKRTHRGLQRGEILCRDGSKNGHVPEPPWDSRSIREQGSNGSRRFGSHARPRAPPPTKEAKRASLNLHGRGSSASIPWSVCARFGHSGPPSPHKFAARYSAMQRGRVLNRLVRYLPRTRCSSIGIRCRTVFTKSRSMVAVANPVPSLTCAAT